MSAPTTLGEAEILKLALAAQVAEVEKLKRELADAKAAKPGGRRRTKKGRAAKGVGATFQVTDKAGVTRWVGEKSFRVDGRRQRVRVYGDSQGEVIEKLAAVTEPTPRTIAGKEFTVAAFAEAFLRTKVGKWGPATMQSRRCIIFQHIVPAFGKIPARKLTSLQVSEYAAAVAEKGEKLVTLARVLEMLGDIYRWGMRQKPKLVSENPVPAKTDRPPVPQPERYLPTEDEVSRFFAEVEGDEYRGLYLLLAGSGMRLGEALGLKWSSYDRFRKLVTITHSLAEYGAPEPCLKEPKTARSKREVPIADDVVTALEERRALVADRGHDGADRPIFGDPIAGRWLRKNTLYRRSFDPAMKRAGVKFVLHSLRHRYAVRLLKGKIPVTVVSKLMGHSRPMMTLDKYANHVRDDDHEGIADILRVPAPKASAGAG